jgi:hypothetical protein
MFFVSFFTPGCCEIDVRQTAKGHNDKQATTEVRKVHEQIGVPGLYQPGPSKQLSKIEHARHQAYTTNLSTHINSKDAAVSWSQPTPGAYCQAHGSLSAVVIEVSKPQIPNPYSAVYVHRVFVRVCVF